MTDFRRMEKAKRTAQEFANRDGGQWCIVQFPDHLVIRPQRRARNLLRKHEECKLVATIGPEAGA